jgi:hypothetical protein
MCHVMHTNEIRSGILLYMCSNANVMTLEHKILVTPKTNSTRGKLLLNYTFELHNILQDNGSDVFYYGIHLKSFQGQ